MTDQSPSPISQPSLQNNSRRSTQIRPNANGKQRFGKGKSRYAQKRNKAKAPVVVQVGPVNDYTSICCRMPAAKPKCGQKETVMSPDTKKPKEVSKGLGTWRCSGCHKTCKVTVSKHKTENSVPTTTDTALV